MSWTPLSGVSLHQGAFLDRLSPCWIRCPSLPNILCITQSLYLIYYNHLLCVHHLEQTMKPLGVLHLIQHPFKVCWMNVHINEWTHWFLSPGWFLRGRVGRRGLIRLASVISQHLLQEIQSLRTTLRRRSHQPSDPWSNLNSLHCIWKKYECLGVEENSHHRKLKKTWEKKASFHCHLNCSNKSVNHLVTEWW